MSTYAGQSIDLPTLLDAVALLARTALGWSAGRVVEWHYTGRPNVDQGRSIVWLRVLGRKPDTASGAGRHGTKTPAVIELNLTTRGFLDKAQTDHRLGRQHWANQYKLENAFYGRMLHDAYDAPTSDTEPPLPSAGANLLTIGTMTAAEIPSPEKPRPEEGYMETRLALEIPTVLKLTLNDVPAA